MYINIWMQVPKIIQKGWICTKYQRWATLVTRPWPPDHIPWPADHGWWPPDYPPGWNGVYDHVEWSLDHFMCHVIDPVCKQTQKGEDPGTLETLEFRSMQDPGLFT